VNFFPFSLAYVHCENFEYTYIVHWLDYPHQLSPSTRFLPHLKLCKTFYHSVSYMYMKSINHILSTSSLLFTLPTPTSPSLLYLFHSPVFHFFNSKANVQRGFSMYPSYERTLVSSTSSVTFPYPFHLTPIIQQLSIHTVISSTCTDVMYLNIVDYHSLFHSLIPWVP
jgi:hypothetical protein